MIDPLDEITESGLTERRVREIMEAHVENFVAEKVRQTARRDHEAQLATRRAGAIRRRHVKLLQIRVHHILAPQNAARCVHV